MTEKVYCSGDHILSVEAKARIIEAVERSAKISQRIRKTQVVYITISCGTIYINETGKAERLTVLI